MVNIDFLEKCQRLVSSPHFMYDFMSHVTFYFLTDLLEILSNMCITIVCKLGCDVIEFDVNHIILIKAFRCMTKKSRKKLKYLDNEKPFEVK